LAAQGREMGFRRCQPDPEVKASLLSSGECYCLPIKNDRDLLALIRFELQPGKRLSQEQKTVFESINDEMALAIKGSQDRKVLSDLRIVEASLQERRNVSHYLHDSLGQNLAFMRLKLSQLLAEKKSISTATVQNDLVHMLDVAEDSYEIVRGTLETMVPQTTPSLTNLLHEYARKVARHAHFHLSFDVDGEPCETLTNIQREVFYVFREVFNNIERHSKATQVGVCLSWSHCELQIDIQDNGIGFDTQAIDPSKHFGYRIIQERITGVMGRVSIETALQSGTRVTINVPLSVKVN
jgi:two-component system, NarL family, sensor histidine kinase DegS